MVLSKNWIDYRTRIRSINKIKKADIYYLAGLFDGEGCVTLGKANNNYTPTYHLNVNIVNTNEALIRWVHSVVGKGGVSQKTRENDHWKDCFTWKVNGEHAVEFIKRIYPYLKVKKAQAEIAIKYGETIKLKGLRMRLTDQEREGRRILFLKLRKINHRNNGVLDGYSN